MEMKGKTKGSKLGNAHIGATIPSITLKPVTFYQNSEMGTFNVSSNGAFVKSTSRGKKVTV